ncbi:MAG TPA: prepilin-type N-terminal cleavage/methylation domain-containing protein, partial [Gammaproteobacteria bacterium]|nr:prepilin-type N-terminal cleavage/methylation domain-containing protein [Gammaproteobacteria bacterium]
SHNPQSGFSLVEILVAMTLSLVLLGGTIVIYASSKDSYRLQENIAGMQENARFAIHALRRDLEMAGFPWEQDITPFAVNGDTLIGNIEVTTDGGGNVSDIVTIQYQSDAPSNRDCQGAVIADGSLIINQYSINNGELRCLGSGNPTRPLTLVENIDNLQVLYGIDSDIDGSANLYVTATEVDAGIINAGTPDWDRVVSLRLALLVASDTSTNSASKDFTLLDAPTITKDDGRIYRVFTATIPLRNRIP